MGVHSLADDIDLLASAVTALFRETTAGRQLVTGFGDTGRAAKLAGISETQIRAWAGGELDLAPRQSMTLVRAVCAHQAAGRRTSAWSDPQAETALSPSEAFRL